MIVGESLSSIEIRDRHQRSSTRIHPKRLIIGRPIKHVRVASLLKQIESDGGLSKIGPHPSGRLNTCMTLESVGRLDDQFALAVFGVDVLPLRVGSAMRNKLVSARLYSFDDL